MKDVIRVDIVINDALVSRGQHSPYQSLHQGRPPHQDSAPLYGFQDPFKSGSSLSRLNASFTGPYFTLTVPNF